MKHTTRSKFSPNKRADIVQEWKEGTPVTELKKKYHIRTNSSIYSWAKTLEKQKPQKLSLTPVKFMSDPYHKEMAEENKKLKDIIINLLLRTP